MVTRPKQVLHLNGTALRLFGFNVSPAAPAGELGRSCVRIGWERRKSNRKPFVGALWVTNPTW
jgi:hypothetical protein